MLRWIKRLILPMAIFLLAIQVFRPSRTNPAIDERREIGALLGVDPPVASILARSCNDCHSNRTVWPWYSGVAPVSWLVVSDVNRGRRVLNLSEWAGYSPTDQRKHLSEICEEVTGGEMPGSSYVLLHPQASVGSADIASICSWTSRQTTTQRKE